MNLSHSENCTIKRVISDSPIIFIAFNVFFFLQILFVVVKYRSAHFQMRLKQLYNIYREVKQKSSKIIIIIIMIIRIIIIANNQQIKKQTQTFSHLKNVTSLCTITLSLRKRTDTPFYLVFSLFFF